MNKILSKMKKCLLIFSLATLPLTLGAHSVSAADVNDINVHRFYNFKNGTHFYTANQSEATYVNDKLYNTYKYEGIAFRGWDTYPTADGQPPIATVHRFYNFKTDTHYLIANQAEATYINDRLYDSYRYEGIAFYTFATTSDHGWVGAHRFYNTRTGDQLYTKDQNETIYISNNLGNVYREENAGFMVQQN